MPSIMPCNEGGRWSDHRPRYLCPAQEGQNSEYQEHEEQYLRNAGRTCGKTAEAENGGDDGNNEKHDCVVKHFYLPPPASYALALCVAYSYQAGFRFIGGGPASR
jgi:hypothetical protein